MNFDRTKLITGYAARFAPLTPDQQTNLDALLTAAEADADVTDVRWLAYMLATVKHECADRWKPIEEFHKGQGRDYGQPVTVTDPDGKPFTNVYYGRGYVQLTWEGNYRKMGDILGNRLVYEPSLALDPDVAYRIMSYGMRHGSFTGVGLGKYIHDATCDYRNARRIINGVDQMEVIAGYATKLEAILRESDLDAAEIVAPVNQGFSVTAQSLHLRNGPGPENPEAAGSPLPEGTTVDGLEDQGDWKRVAVRGSVNGVAGATGWVKASFLTAAT